MQLKQSSKFVAEQQQQQQYDAEGSLSTGMETAEATPPFKSRTDAKLVRGARAVVMLVLLVSAVTVAALAYVLLSRSEQDGFQTEFESSARQVILMANRNAINVFTSFHTMAAIYPSNAKKSNETLPFVTIDGFDTIVEGFRNLSKASLVHFSPLLRTETDLQKWNQYAMSQQHWIAKNRHFYPSNAANVSNDIVPFAFEFGGEHGIYPASAQNQSVVPAWQMSPLPPQLSLINYNCFQFEACRVSLEYAAETGQPSLTEPNDGVRGFFAIEVQGPLSLLHYPVYNDVMAKSEKDVVGF